MLGSFDQAILDRFFHIHFSTVPETPQASRKKFVIDNTSALVNWAYSVPKNILQRQIRVGPLIYFALEENPFMDFITSRLTPDLKSFISNAELLDLVATYFKDSISVSRRG